MAPVTEYLRLAQVVTKAFEEEGIRCGIIGGLALIIMGFRDRQTKDLDCIAHTSRDRAIATIKKIPEMTWTQGTKQDMTSFLYKAYPDSDALLLEIFLLNMSGIDTQPSNFGHVLLPHFCFKSKLQAAAYRNDKPQDGLDLEFLIKKFPQQLTPFTSHFAPMWVGIAAQRHPGLKKPFASLGIDVKRCIAHAVEKGMTPIELGREAEMARSMFGWANIQTSLTYGLVTHKDLVPVEREPLVVNPRARPVLAGPSGTASGGAGRSSGLSPIDSQKLKIAIEWWRQSAGKSKEERENFLGGVKQHAPNVYDAFVEILQTQRQSQ